MNFKHFNSLLASGNVDAGDMADSPAASTPKPQHTAEDLVKLWSDYMIEGARYGDEEDVQEALRNSADVDAKDEEGRTALHMAAANAYMSIARRLLQAGANTEVQNETGSTALHWACVAGSAPMVELLLANGANPAALNMAGQAPIDGALENGTVCEAFQAHSSRQGNVTVIPDTQLATGDDAAEESMGRGPDFQGTSVAADGVAERLEGVRLK